MSCRRSGVPFALVLLVSIRALPALASLTPDQILLVVNKNCPDSQPLARLYCRLRNVPADQIVILDVQNAEEMSFEDYEAGVVAPIRSFLNQHHLRSQIKCLLTFYGVPFRIRNKVNSPADNQEMGEIKSLIGATINELRESVQKLEVTAQAVSPTFQPGRGDTPEALQGREQAAIEAISASLTSAAPAQRQDLLNQLTSSLRTVWGDAELDKRLGAAERNDVNISPEQREHWIELHQVVTDAQDQQEQLEGERWDRQARDQLRHLSAAHFGLLGLLRVLIMQQQYLTPDDSASATDNELALLWWNYYPRRRWLPNPLNYTFEGRAPQTMMVMRLDGPDVPTVERMMRTSVQVEKTGLMGAIAVDARGIQPIDDKGNLTPFGEFDETLRHLATIVRIRTHLRLAFDDQELVFPPHFVKNVACYCGWYSLQHYIPGCDFNPGAVGYHVASYELTQLHSPSSEWVRGLLSDGVVATLGAVAEPYLSAFPKPDDFFPLLMTGKLTMAEVYWKTTPFTSWMITFIGDPLYTPYKTDPALTAEDLPVGLRRALR